MPNRNHYLQVIGTCWLIGKFISYKVWLAERLYPVVPLFSFTEETPPLAHTMLYAISIFCLAALAVKPAQKSLLPILMLSELFSCLLDVTRWQPWEYQYLFMVLAFVTNRDEKNLRATLVFILASLYVFSGLQKCNGGFLYAVWNKMIIGRFLGFDTVANLHPALHYAGFILPMLEILAGILLLFSKNKWPAVLLIVMHVFVLLLLGPLGLQANEVVWPWNLALIVLLYMLFLRQETTLIGFSFLLRRQNWVPVLLLGVLPVAGLFGYWDQYLSGGLYSGNTLYMSICLDSRKVVPELEHLVVTAQRPAGCVNRLKIHNWALEELKVVPYPETWYYKRFREEWRKKYKVAHAGFIIYHYPVKEYRPL